MERPSKSVATRTGHMSKKDIDAKPPYETKLRGEVDKLKDHLFWHCHKEKYLKGLLTI